MSNGRDDDALAWAGDDDPTLVPEGSPLVDDEGDDATAEPRGRTVLDEAEDAEDLIAERELAAAEAASKQMSSAALIAFGVLGGVYLLYTIGWIISFTRVEVASELTFGVFTDIVARSLAIAASPFWFIATLVLTQKKDVRYTMLWLVIGMLVLVPWPFLIGRAS